MSKVKLIVTSRFVQHLDAVTFPEMKWFDFSGQRMSCLVEWVDWLMHAKGTGLLSFLLHVLVEEHSTSVRFLQLNVPLASSWAIYCTWRLLYLGFGDHTFVFIKQFNSDTFTVQHRMRDKRFSLCFWVKQLLCQWTSWRVRNARLHIFEKKRTRLGLLL